MESPPRDVFHNKYEKNTADYLLPLTEGSSDPHIPNNCFIALFEYVTNLFWDFLLVPKDAHNQTYFSFLFEPRLVLMRLSFIPASVSLQ